MIALSLKVAVSLAAVALLGACTSQDSTASDDTEVLISVAASLTDVFIEIETVFEAQNPGVDVLLNIAGSATLSAQILEGAPADVFASASISTMTPLVEAGLTSSEPQVFAHNDMEIAVPTGNPGGVSSLDDFSSEDLLIGLCSDGVPCGDLAREVLSKAGVDPAIDTNEPNVRSLLTKLEIGELDIGIVYATDVAASNSVDGIEIPDEDNVVAEYPIAIISGSNNPPEANALVAFVMSPEGQAILTRHGFSSP